MAKPSIIFLPGFMCDERLFAAQKVACENAGITVIFADLDTSMTITGLAGDILARAPESFALAGLSMGGIVAMELYRQAAERITHLVLLNTTPHADTKQKQRKEQIARVADGELGLVMQEELKPQYLASVNRSQDRLDLLNDMAQQLGEFTFTRQSLALMARQGYEDLLPQIECPTLVLTGYQDKVCTPNIHIEMAAAIPNARLAIFPDCGHLSTIERPGEVSSALLSLMRDAGNSTAQPTGSKNKGLHLVSQTERD